MLACTNQAIDVFKTICKAPDTRPHMNLEICLTKCLKYRVEFESGRKSKKHWKKNSLSIFVSNTALWVLKLYRNES